MISILITIAALAVPHADTINQHWASYAQNAAHVRYLTLAPVPEAEQGNWHNALQFGVPSASPATVLAEHLPRRLDGTLAYYIDLHALRWDTGDWLKVLEKYPYSADKNPLVVRGDWLLAEISDPRFSQALYLLLYGSKNVPKTDSDFLKFWGVDASDKGVTRFGWVETNSQVNKARTRFVQRFTGRDGKSVWQTMDSFDVEPGKDPLEALDEKFDHDGRELIAQFVKVSGKAGKRINGAAQAYLLADGNGNVVQVAPVELVEDFHQALGHRAIVNHGSCIVCHEAGMKFPTENGLERFLLAGVELKVYDAHRREQIEAFHLTDAGRQLSRDNEDYADFVRACNGLSTQDNASNYRHVLALYRKPLTLRDAARELYCTPEDLRFALGYAAANKIEIGSRLAGLAHGIAIPRKQWEGDYLKAQAMVNVWQAGNPTPALMAAAAGSATPQKVQMRLVVTCPAQAVVFIGKRQMTADGERREFTAEVKPDWKATMVVTAVLVVDGRELRDSREVECEAGKTVEVAFEFKQSEGQS